MGYQKSTPGEPRLLRTPGDTWDTSPPPRGPGFGVQPEAVSGHSSVWQGRPDLPWRGPGWALWGPGRPGEPSHAVLTVAVTDAVSVAIVVVDVAIVDVVVVFAVES